MFSNKEYINFIESSRQKALPLVVVSVIKTLGSTYAKTGNMLLFDSLGNSVGVLGSPALHKKLFELSKQALKERKSIVYENLPKDKTSGHGISEYLIEAVFYEDDYSFLGKALKNKGKTLVRNLQEKRYDFIDEKKNTFEQNSFYQYIQMPYSLLIFGSGSHVSSLVDLGNLMGWKTSVLDMNMKKESVKNADELIYLEKLEDILTFDFNPFNASVILSHSPKTDDTYLEALLSSSIEYIGIMGNKNNMQKKIEKFSLEKEERFFAPVGLDLGAKTHQGIALCVCSQIEARKNGKI